MDLAFGGDGLLSLPNELLLHILNTLRTKDLLPLCVLSQRLYSLILRIIQHRLSVAASLRGQSLLLECYHPLHRLTQPTLTCDYLGTSGLEDTAACDNDSKMAKDPAKQLRCLRGLYSRYRPHRNNVASKLTGRHPAGDIPGSRTYLGNVGVHFTNQSRPRSASQSSTSDEPVTQEHGVVAPGKEFIPPLVTHTVHLDSSELFVQLRTDAVVGVMGPLPGSYRKLIDVTNGQNYPVIRVHRNWLAEQVEVSWDLRPSGPSGEENTIARPNLLTESFPDALSQVLGKGKVKSRNDEEQRRPRNETLWVNDGEQNVGIRFTVRHCKWKRNNPILVSVEEDAPVSYDLQYGGMFGVPEIVQQRTADRSNVKRRASDKDDSFTAANGAINVTRTQYF